MLDASSLLALVMVAVLGFNVPTIKLPLVSRVLAAFLYKYVSPPKTILVGAEGELFGNWS